MATVAVALACFAACNRQEAPPSGRPARSSQPAGDARPRDGLQPGSSRPKRCVVETPSAAPPSASKAESCPKDPTGNPELPRGFVTFVEAPGSPRVAVEVAREESHRERGLMYRTSMPDDEGMLFSWRENALRSFWMRNTCIPLDMLFIADDGFITGILENVPTMNEASRAIPCPAQHVLEVNAGWCRSHGVEAGQRVVLDGP